MSSTRVAAGSAASVSSAASNSARLARSLSPVRTTRLPATFTCSVPMRGSTITGCTDRASFMASVAPNSRSSE